MLITPQIIPALTRQEATLLLIAIGTQDKVTDKQRHAILEKGGLLEKSFNPLLVELCKMAGKEPTQDNLKQFAKAAGVSINAGDITPEQYKDTLEKAYPTYDALCNMLDYATSTKKNIKKDARNITVFKKIIVTNPDYLDEDGKEIETLVDSPDNLPALVCELFEQAMIVYGGKVPPFILNNSSNADAAAKSWVKKKVEYSRARNGHIIERAVTRKSKKGKFKSVNKFCVDFSLTPNQIADMFAEFGKMDEYQAICQEVEQREQKKKAELKAYRQELARHMQARRAELVATKRAKQAEKTFTPAYMRNTKKKK